MGIYAVTVKGKADDRVLAEFRHPTRFGEYRLNIGGSWYKVVEEEEGTRRQVLLVVPE